jgi:hypothetical protein
MIARIWNGRVPRRHADGFQQHLLATGVASSARLAGHAGAQILRRDCGGHVDFRLITYWQSWDAIRQFAGPDPSAAVLYPGDERYQLVPCLTVEHHLVAYATALPQDLTT